MADRSTSPMTLTYGHSGFLCAEGTNGGTVHHSHYINIYIYNTHTDTTCSTFLFGFISVISVAMTSFSKAHESSIEDFSRRFITGIHEVGYPELYPQGASCSGPQCAEACVGASKRQHEALGIQLKLEIEIEMKKTVPVQLSLISPLRSLNLVCFQKLRCPTSLVPLWMMMRNP